MIRALLMLGLLATSASAEDVTTDAFGVFPSALLESRENWAGYRTTTGGASSVQRPSDADAVVLFVGPKSIVAGIEPGHAVALVLDGHGNLLHGVSTEFELGFGDTIKVETRLGIANHLFRPPPESGAFLAGASVDGIQSARADYRVTAHLATVQPAALPNFESVLQETFGNVATVPLVDAYGNTVDDGVGLSVVLTDSDGTSSFLHSVVRDGAAQATVLSRNISGSISGKFALAGRQSDNIALEIDRLVIADVGDLAVWSEPDINAVRVQIGPLQTDRGYLAPDGTPAHVDIVGRSGLSASAAGWVLDGYLAFTMPLPAEADPFKLTLSVSDNSHEATVALTSPPENDRIRGAE